MTGTWAPTHAVALAASTRAVYAHVYDRHLSPHLGSLELRAITPETVARWQAQRLAAGVGAHAVRKAITVLGAILQRAVEAHRIPYNPVRATRKAKLPERGEVRPLAPRDVEAMRAFLLAGGSEHPHRDACLVSVLAYAGLRPGEALALTWGNVLDGTLVVNASKTGRRRSVRLLAPLAGDLREWRLASGRPGPNALLFPASDGKPWSHEGYKSWARRAFRRAGSPRARRTPPRTRCAIRSCPCSWPRAAIRSTSPGRPGTGRASPLTSTGISTPSRMAASGPTPRRSSGPLAKAPVPVSYPPRRSRPNGSAAERRK